MSPQQRKKKSAILTNKLVLEAMRTIMDENSQMLKELLNQGKFICVGDGQTNQIRSNV